MPVEIVPADEADAGALAAASKAAFDSDASTYPGIEPGGPPGYDSADVLRAKIAAHTVFTMRLDGDVVGGMVVQDEGGGTLHLDLLFIHPDQHNRGIGSAAMAFLDRACPAIRWTLQTPQWATRNRYFYEKFGYRTVGETVTPDITLVDYERWVPRVTDVSTQVSLRLLRPADAPRLAALLTRSREHMAPWEPDRAQEYFTAEGQRAVVERDLAQRAEDRCWPAVICLDGEVVGRMTLFGFIRGPFQSSIVGYWVSVGYTRRGIASRALELAVAVAFTELSLHRVEASVQVGNAASHGVLLRNGFRRVGVLERHFLTGGRWHDDVLYERVDAGRTPRISR